MPGHIGEQDAAPLPRRDRGRDGGARGDQLRRRRARTSPDEFGDVSGLVVTESDCRTG